MFFFFNDTTTTEIYTLSLHDALPISGRHRTIPILRPVVSTTGCKEAEEQRTSVSSLLLTEVDRKSTRLNSSHSQISYAVFCLKKKTSTIICLKYHHRSKSSGEQLFHP